MYLEHFGLSALPFSLTPDTDFIYSNDAHQEALNTLLIATFGGEGFVKITGEVGTGKTLLCRRFLATLDEQYVVAYLPNPQLEPRTILLAIAEELGLAEEKLDYQFRLINHLNQHLLDLATQGKKVIVIIDEAQGVPLETLETLRLLSNLETEKQKLIQTVLFGQPELDEKLADPTVRQLRQRIVFSYRMPGLQAHEVNHYLAHRLRIAGHRDGDIFSAAAVRLIYRLSAGTPRLVNILAHKALLLAYGEGRARIGRSHIVTAARDTEGVKPMAWWWR
jgi:MSHA biogenesis protein MshM